MMPRISEVGSLQSPTVNTSAWRRRAGLLVMLAACVVLVPIEGAAQTTVSPGGWIYPPAVRRGVECWIGFSPSDCTGARWKSPGLPTEASGTLIRGTFAPVIPVGIGQENRAIAWLDYEFAIEGTRGFVNTTISVKHDLVTMLVGGAAYAANTLLTMQLTDISDPNEAFLGSATLWDGNRQGDQGVTDVAAGSEQHIASGEVGSLSMTLARGRNYRVRITAQGSGTMLILGTASAVTEAQIHYVRVQADPDVFVRLEDHDAEIKELLAAHDADIKALLTNLQGGQAEIIRLLLTPQGRRSTALCAAGECSFPNK